MRLGMGNEVVMSVMEQVKRDIEKTYEYQCGYSEAIRKVKAICDDYAKRKIDDDLFIMRVCGLVDKESKVNRKN